MTEVFVEQPLASPGSANYVAFSLSDDSFNISSLLTRFVSLFTFLTSIIYDCSSVSSWAIFS